MRADGTTWSINEQLHQEVRRVALEAAEAILEALTPLLVLRVVEQVLEAAEGRQEPL